MKEHPFKINYLSKDEQWLLSEYIDLPHAKMQLFGDTVYVKDPAHLKIITGFQRLKKHEPLQYILGRTEFFGCQICVNPTVLIPRQETEILVEIVHQEMKRRRLSTVLDLCTGSGCIGIALKKFHPAVKVILSDISRDALLTAMQNARLNRVNVEIRTGDLLNPIGDREVDMVICNPPYIATEEYHCLAPSVRDYEPRIALEGGKTGLEFYVRLADDLPRVMKKGGVVFLEIAHHQKLALMNLYSEKGWRRVECIKDWSGHDRFMVLER